jgi:hypothetical protein
LSSKPKEEPAVVALQVVVHESTSKLTSATGVMVHLFHGDVEVVMISWIISFRKKGHLEGCGANTWGKHHDSDIGRCC